MALYAVNVFYMLKIISAVIQVVYIRIVSSLHSKIDFLWWLGYLRAGVRDCSN